MQYITNTGVQDFGPSNGCREGSHGSESSGGAALPRPTVIQLIPIVQRTDDSNRDAYAPLRARMAAANA